MLEKIEKIQELLNVPNVDASTETAIANMKILNLLVDLRAEAEQLILSGVGNSTSLKEMLVDFGNVVRNSKRQEVELLADAYIVYDRIKEEKEQ